MNLVTARLSLVTLGVSDLARSVRFYGDLGFVRKARATGEGVAFFDAGGVVLSLYPWNALADDAVIAPEPRPKAFRGSALAWNCASPEEVDDAMARAMKAGARLLKKPANVFWGGYSGYFADPDEHPWEIAHNPFFPLTQDGRLILPE